MAKTSPSNQLSPIFHDTHTQLRMQNGIAVSLCLCVWACMCEQVSVHVTGHTNCNWFDWELTAGLLILQATHTHTGHTHTHIRNVHIHTLFQLITVHLTKSLLHNSLWTKCDVLARAFTKMPGYSHPVCCNSTKCNTCCSFPGCQCNVITLHYNVNCCVRGNSRGWNKEDFPLWPPK